MEWVSVEDSLPPLGVEVLAFRPNALLDWSDKPLRLCRLKEDGGWTGCHKVTHWLQLDVPPGWTIESDRRQDG